jgi:hypothetical protein
MAKNSDEETTTLIARFTLKRETKGAVLYKEVNKAGEQLEMSDPKCKVGSLYIRKLAFPNEKFPTNIKVKIVL